MDVRQQIVIDPEFRSLIPPLSSEERAQLEQNIVREGCRDPLVVWTESPETGYCKACDAERSLTTGDGVAQCDVCGYGVAPIEEILLDGHNRYEICRVHHLPFDTEFIALESREDALTWIINNQLGRRNLTPEQRDYLLGKKYNREKTAGHGDKSAGQNDPQNRETAERIADEYKVSEKTVKRAGQFAEAVDTLAANAGEDIREQVLTRDTRLSKETVVKLAKADADTQRAVLKKLRTGEAARPQEALRQVKAEQIGAREAVMPSGKFRVLYADPPWSYGNTQPDYHPEQRDHYPVMALKEICALPVKDLAEDDAVLFLWVTSPMLEESFQVLEAWDFAYKASFVWDKVKHNMGHYNSVRHEFLLIAVRGSCQPDVRKLFDSVVTQERTEHSRKPAVFYDIIETLYPHGRRLELFAREARPGWETYGNQVGAVAA